MEIKFFITAYIAITTLSVMLIIYLYIYNRDLFDVALRVLSVIGSISMPFMFGLNGIILLKADDRESAIDYGNNVNLFINQIFEKFIQHPEMMYMFNDMMNVPNTKNILRYKDKEVLIGCYIFANCAKVAGYIYESSNEYDSERIRRWLTKVLDQYLKSPILMSVWTDHYKPLIAGPLLIRFMKDTFSI